MFCIGVLKVDCVAAVEILVLGAVFVVEVLAEVFVVVFMGQLLLSFFCAN